jgi:cystathionine beta-synthase
LSKVHSEEWLKENRLLEGFDPSVREILGQRPAEVPAIVHVDENTPVREAVNLVRQYDVSQVPVLHQGANVGVLKESKLLRLALEDDTVLDQPAASVMDPPLPEIGVSESTDRVKEHLSKRDGAVLVRDDDRIVGILTRYDLLDYIL